MTTALQAMSDVILEYKGFEFKVNPADIEISTGRELGISRLYDGTASVCEAGLKPVVIKGKGVLYGDDAEKHCMLICELLKCHSSGRLYYPSSGTLRAFFTQFDYRLDSKSNSVSYSFTFVEDCSGRRADRLFEYTPAEKGDNAFIIANRECVSVSEIMRLNNYPTPFEIKEGDRVKIR